MTACCVHVHLCLLGQPCSRVLHTIIKRLGFSRCCMRATHFQQQKLSTQYTPREGGWPLRKKPFVTDHERSQAPKPRPNPASATLPKPPDPIPLVKDLSFMLYFPILPAADIHRLFPLKGRLSATLACISLSATL